MIDGAIKLVEADLLRAMDESRLADDLARIASARMFGLIEELCTLVQVKRERERAERLREADRAKVSPQTR
jgi:hypothetical protein